MTNQAMLDSIVYKTYYAIALGAEPLKSKKSHKKFDSAMLSEESPSKKKLASKPKPTKKKAPVKADRGKGLNVLSEVALSHVAQLKEATKRSKKDFHISYASGSGDGTDFQSGVFDEQQRKISGTDEGIGAKQSREEDNDDEDDTKDDEGNNDDDDDDYDDDDDGNDDDDSDHKRTESNRDENPNLNQFNEEHEEEENDDEFTDKEYDDGAHQHNVSQESEFDQEEEDAHVTLTTVHDTQKTECPMQSSSVSSDFIEKLLNFKNVSPADNEIASLMDTTVHTEEPSGQTSTLFTVPITVIPTTIPLPPHFFNPLPQQTIPTPTPTASEVTTAFLALPDFASVFRFNNRVTNLERDLEEAQAGKQEYIDLVDLSVRTIIKEEVKTQIPQILPKGVLNFTNPSTYEAAASISEYELTKNLLDKMEESKSHLRADYKRELYDALVKKSSKDAESSRDPKSNESKSTSSSKGTSRSHHKSSGQTAYAEEPSHTVDDSGVPKNQEFNTGNNDEQPKDEAAPKNDWFKKPKRPLTPDPDWNKRQHIDFRPSQTWISVTARAEKPNTSFYELMDTPIDFSAFVINRLNITNLTQELLSGSARNVEASGLLHQGYSLILDHLGRQVIPQDYFINNDLEYLKGGRLNRQYSTFVTKIKAATYEIKWIKDLVPNLWTPVKVVYDKHAYWVTRLKIMKMYDYDHLDEIKVRREDQLYTFKEGVKSYQKKLNLTKPDIFKSNLRNRTTYTAYSDPQGVIYKDQNNINRLMRTDELHKLNDGTLNDVRTALYDITLGIRMEYLLKIKWSGLDKRRACVMIQDIDKQLFQRRLMQNVEKFIGGREYGEDPRLLTRTI
ncbi:hypothetical protein Tco_0843800 [Tanacetum coccineum]